MQSYLDFKRNFRKKSERAVRAIVRSIQDQGRRAICLVTAVCFIVTGTGIPVLASEFSQFNYNSQNTTPKVVIPDIKVPEPNIQLPTLPTNTVQNAMSYFDKFDINLSGKLDQITDTVSQPALNVESPTTNVANNVNNVVTQGLTNIVEKSNDQTSTVDSSTIKDVVDQTSAAPEDKVTNNTTTQTSSGSNNQTVVSPDDAEKLKDDFGSVGNLVQQYLSGNSGTNANLDEYKLEDLENEDVSNIANTLSSPDANSKDVANVLTNMDSDLAASVADEMSTDSLTSALDEMPVSSSNTLVNNTSAETQGELNDYYSTNKNESSTISQTEPPSGFVPQTGTYTQKEDVGSGASVVTVKSGVNDQGTVRSTALYQNGKLQDGWNFTNQTNQEDNQTNVTGSTTQNNSTTSSTNNQTVPTTQHTGTAVDPGTVTPTNNQTNTTSTKTSNTTNTTLNSNNVNASTTSNKTNSSGGSTTTTNQTTTATTNNNSASVNGATVTTTGTGADKEMRKDFSNGAYIIYTYNEAGNISGWTSYDTHGNLAESSSTSNWSRNGAVGASGPTQAQIQADILAGNTSAKYGDINVTYTYNTDGTVTVSYVTKSAVETDDGDGGTNTSWETTYVTATYDKDGKIINQAEVCGDTTTYISYDENGNMTQKEVIGSNTHYIISFDSSGNRTKFENLLTGTSITYTYDSYNRMTSYTDQDGVVHNVAVPPGTSTSLTYTFDADGKVTGAVSKNGDSFTYDDQGRVTSIVRADGTTITVTKWDENGRATEGSYSLDGDSGTIYFTYNADGLLNGDCRVSGSNSLWTYYSYSDSGELSQAVTMDQDGQTTYTFYKDGKAIGGIDEDNNLWGADGISAEDRKWLINIYYNQMLGRDAGEADYALWEGKTFEEISTGILNSEEYATKVITDAYTTMLGRDITADELATYMADVRANGFDAEAFTKALRTTSEFINGQGFVDYMNDYAQRYFRRDATAAEIAYWREQVLAGNWDINKLDAIFMKSDEYKGQVASVAALMDIAKDYLGMDATIQDLQNLGWLDANGNSTMTINTIVNAMKTSAVYLLRVLGDMNLKQTDPVHYKKPKSGLFKAIVMAIIQVVVTCILTYIMGPLGTILAGAIFGAINAAQNGGNIFKGAIMGAAMAVATMVFSAVANAVVAAAKAVATGAQVISAMKDAIVGTFNAMMDAVGNMATLVKTMVQKAITQVASAVLQETGLADKLGAVGTALVMLAVSAVAAGVAQGTVNEMGLNTDAPAAGFSEGFKEGFNGALSSGMSQNGGLTTAAVVTTIAKTAAAAYVEDRLEAQGANDFLVAFASSMTGAAIVGAGYASFGSGTGTSGDGVRDLGAKDGTDGGGDGTGTKPGNTTNSVIDQKDGVGAAGVNSDKGPEVTVLGNDGLKAGGNVTMDGDTGNIGSQSSDELSNSDVPAGTAESIDATETNISNNQMTTSLNNQDSIRDSSNTIDSAPNENSQLSPSETNHPNANNTQSIADFSNSQSGLTQDNTQKDTTNDSSTRQESDTTPDSQNEDSQSQQPQSPQTNPQDLNQTPQRPDSLSAPGIDALKEGDKTNNNNLDLENNAPDQPDLNNDTPDSISGENEKLPSKSIEDLDKTESGIDNRAEKSGRDPDVGRRDDELGTPKGKDANANAGGGGGSGEGDNAGGGSENNQTAEQKDDPNQTTPGKPGETGKPGTKSTIESGGQRQDSGAKQDSGYKGLNALQDFGRETLGTSLTQMLTTSIASGIQEAFQKMLTKMYVKEVYDVKELAGDNGLTPDEMQEQLESSTDSFQSNLNDNSASLTSAWQSFTDALTYGTQQTSKGTVEETTFGDKRTAFDNGSSIYKPMHSDTHYYSDAAGNVQALDAKTNKPVDFASMSDSQKQSVVNQIANVAANYAAMGNYSAAASASLAAAQMAQQLSMPATTVQDYVSQAQTQAMQSGNGQTGDVQSLAQVDLVKSSLAVQSGDVAQAVADFGKAMDTVQGGALSSEMKGEIQVAAAQQMEEAVAAFETKNRNASDQTAGEMQKLDAKITEALTMAGNNFKAAEGEKQIAGLAKTGKMAVAQAEAKAQEAQKAETAEARDEKKAQAEQYRAIADDMVGALHEGFEASKTLDSKMQVARLGAIADVGTEKAKETLRTEIADLAATQSGKSENPAVQENAMKNWESNEVLATAGILQNAGGVDTAVQGMLGNVTRSDLGSVEQFQYDLLDAQTCSDARKQETYNQAASQAKSDVQKLQVAQTLLQDASPAAAKFQADMVQNQMEAIQTEGLARSEALASGFAEAAKAMGTKMFGDPAKRNEAGKFMDMAADKLNAALSQIAAGNLSTMSAIEMQKIQNAAVEVGALANAIGTANGEGSVASNRDLTKTASQIQSEYANNPNYKTETVVVNGQNVLKLTDRSNGTYKLFGVQDEVVVKTMGETGVENTQSVAWNVSYSASGEVLAWGTTDALQHPSGELTGATFQKTSDGQYKLSGKIGSQDYTAIYGSFEPGTQTTLAGETNTLVAGSIVYSKSGNTEVLYNKDGSGTVINGLDTQGRALQNVNGGNAVRFDESGRFLDAASEGTGQADQSYMRKDLVFQCNLTNAAGKKTETQFTDHQFVQTTRGEQDGVAYVSTTIRNSCMQTVRETYATQHEVQDLGEGRSRVMDNYQRQNDYENNRLIRSAQTADYVRVGTEDTFETKTGWEMISEGTHDAKGNLIEGTTTEKANGRLVQNGEQTQKFGRYSNITTVSSGNITRIESAAAWMTSQVGKTAVSYQNGWSKTSSGTHDVEGNLIDGTITERGASRVVKGEGQSQTFTDYKNVTTVEKGAITEITSRAGTMTSTVGQNTVSYQNGWSKTSSGTHDAEGNLIDGTITESGASRVVKGEGQSQRFTDYKNVTTVEKGAITEIASSAGTMTSTVGQNTVSYQNGWSKTSSGTHDAEGNLIDGTITESGASRVVKGEGQSQRFTDYKNVTTVEKGAITEIASSAGTMTSAAGKNTVAYQNGWSKTSSGTHDVEGNLIDGTITESGASRVVKGEGQSQRFTDYKNVTTVEKGAITEIASSAGTMTSAAGPNTVSYQNGWNKTSSGTHDAEGNLVDGTITESGASRVVKGEGQSQTFTDYKNVTTVEKGAISEIASSAGTMTSAAGPNTVSYQNGWNKTSSGTHDAEGNLINGTITESGASRVVKGEGQSQTFTDYTNVTTVEKGAITEITSSAGTMTSKNGDTVAAFENGWSKTSAGKHDAQGNLIDGTITETGAVRTMTDGKTTRRLEMYSSVTTIEDGKGIVSTQTSAQKLSVTIDGVTVEKGPWSSSTEGAKDAKGNYLAGTHADNGQLLNGTSRTEILGRDKQKTGENEYLDYDKSVSTATYQDGKLTESRTGLYRGTELKYEDTMSGVTGWDDKTGAPTSYTRTVTRFDVTQTQEKNGMRISETADVSETVRVENGQVVEKWNTQTNRVQTITYQMDQSGMSGMGLMHNPYALVPMGAQQSTKKMDDASSHTVYQNGEPVMIEQVQGDERKVTKALPGQTLKFNENGQPVNAIITDYHKGHPVESLVINGKTVVQQSEGIRVRLDSRDNMYHVTTKYGEEKLVTQDGVEKTTWGARMGNDVLAAAGQLRSGWDNWMESIPTNTFWDNLSHSFSLIGKSFLTGIAIIASPITGGLNAFADNFLRNFDNAPAAALYVACKVVAQNAVLIAAIPLGAIGGTALILSGILAEMAPGGSGRGMFGFVGSALASVGNTLNHFFIQPFIQLGTAVVAAVKSYGDQNKSRYDFADAMVAVSGALIQVAFAFHMAKGPLNRVATIFSKRNAVEAVAASKLSLAEKTSALGEIARCESRTQVRDVMRNLGLETPSPTFLGTKVGGWMSSLADTGAMRSLRTAGRMAGDAMQWTSRTLIGKPMGLIRTYMLGNLGKMFSSTMQGAARLSARIGGGKVAELSGQGFGVMRQSIASMRLTVQGAGINAAVRLGNSLATRIGQLSPKWGERVNRGLQGLKLSKEMIDLQKSGNIGGNAKNMGAASKIYENALIAARNDLNLALKSGDGRGLYAKAEAFVAAEANLGNFLVRSGNAAFARAVLDRLASQSTQPGRISMQNTGAAGNVLASMFKTSPEMANAIASGMSASKVTAHRLAAAKAYRALASNSALATKLLGAEGVPEATAKGIVKAAANQSRVMGNLVQALAKDKAAMSKAMQSAGNSRGALMDAVFKTDSGRATTRAMKQAMNVLAENPGLMSDVVQIASKTGRSAMREKLRQLSRETRQLEGSFMSALGENASAMSKHMEDVAASKQAQRHVKDFAGRVAKDPHAAKTMGDVLGDQKLSGSAQRIFGDYLSQAMAENPAGKTIQPLLQRFSAQARSAVLKQVANDLMQSGEFSRAKAFSEAVVKDFRKIAKTKEGLDARDTKYVREQIRRLDGEIIKATENVKTASGSGEVGEGGKAGKAGDAKAEKATPEKAPQADMLKTAMNALASALQMKKNNKLEPGKDSAAGTGRAPFGMSGYRMADMLKSPMETGYEIAKTLSGLRMIEGIGMSLAKGIHGSVGIFRAEWTQHLLLNQKGAYRAMVEKTRLEMSKLDAQLGNLAQQAAQSSPRQTRALIEKMNANMVKQGKVAARQNELLKMAESADMLNQARMSGTEVDRLDVDMQTVENWLDYRAIAEYKNQVQELREAGNAFAASEQALAENAPARKQAVKQRRLNQQLRRQEAASREGTTDAWNAQNTEAVNHTVQSRIAETALETGRQQMAQRMTRAIDAMQVHHAKKTLVENGLKKVRASAETRQDAVARAFRKLAGQLAEASLAEQSVAGENVQTSGSVDGVHQRLQQFAEVLGSTKTLARSLIEQCVKSPENGKMLEMTAESMGKLHPREQAQLLEPLRNDMVADLMGKLPMQSKIDLASAMSRSQYARLQETYLRKAAEFDRQAKRFSKEGYHGKAAEFEKLAAEQYRRTAELLSGRSAGEIREMLAKHGQLAEFGETAVIQSVRQNHAKTLIQNRLLKQIDNLRDFTLHQDVELPVEKVLEKFNASRSLVNKLLAPKLTMETLGLKAESQVRKTFEKTYQAEGEVKVSTETLQRQVLRKMGERNAAVREFDNYFRTLKVIENSVSLEVAARRFNETRRERNQPRIDIGKINAQVKMGEQAIARKNQAIRNKALQDMQTGVEVENQQILDSFMSRERLQLQEKALDAKRDARNLEMDLLDMGVQGKQRSLTALWKRYQYNRATARVRSLENQGGRIAIAPLANTLKVAKTMDVFRQESDLAMALEMEKVAKSVEGKSGAEKENVLSEKADMTTEGFESRWDYYKEVLDNTSPETRDQHVRQTHELEVLLQERIPRAEDGSVKSGIDLFRAFEKVRDAKIADGMLPGSVEDARLVRVYSEVAFQRVTGYQGMRLAQKVMLAEFFAGKNVGLRAGGGKTNPFILFPGMSRILAGKALRAEILVDDAPAIEKYLTEAQNTGLKQGDLAKAFGVELVNGNTLQKANRYSELVQALRDPNKVVVFDHTTRAHLRNAEVSNRELREALAETNHVGIDEVHMAATSQTSAIIGGNVSKPKIELVRTVDRLMNDLGFDAAAFETAARDNKLAKLGRGFEVMDYRGKSLSENQMARINASSRKQIILMDGEIKLNRSARIALSRYTDGQVSSVLRTLYSKTGKAGEYNSYHVGENGHIFPVDHLGKIQFEQISNDIVGQITAARKHGKDPYASVRVNHTSMQTSMSAMYAGNFGARIVGASGTIAGIESLMKSKIGSGSSHISTSMLSIEDMVRKTGGEVLDMSSVERADKAVIDSVMNKWDAAVFEASPVKQQQLVEKYMKALEARGVKDGVISVISAQGTGFYVRESRGTALLKSKTFQGLLEAAEVAPENASVVKGKLQGFDYIEVKDGVQAIVQSHKADAKTGKKLFLDAPQITIFNEQGAVGKNFQNRFTLVVRDAHKMTADMLTQTLLRTGRPHAKGAWETKRYVVVDSKEMANTVQTARNEIRAQEIKSLLDMNNVNDQTILRILNAKSSNLGEMLKLNAEYRQMEMVGDSTRFAVQDTFRDRIVIDPLKKAMRNLAEGSRHYRIIDKSMSDALNRGASGADLKLRLKGNKSGSELNRDYLKNNFEMNIREGQIIWRSVLWRSVINFSIPNIRTALEMRNQFNQAKNAVQKNNLPVRSTNTNFAEAKDFQELYVVGKNLMEKVLSKETGGSEAGALANQAVRIVQQAADGRLKTSSMKEFRSAWRESHQQVRGQSTLAGAMATLYTQDKTVARMAMANSAEEALRILQVGEYDKLRENASDSMDGVQTPLPGLTPAIRNLTATRLTGLFGNDSRMAGLLQQDLTRDLELRWINQQADNAASEWATPQWQEQHADEVAQYKNRYGDEWLNRRLEAHFGLEMDLARIYVGKTSAVERFIMRRQAPARYFERGLRNIAAVNQVIPQLAADPEKALAYQGRTMTFDEAGRYIQEQLRQSQSMAVRYGFTVAPELMALSATQDVIERKNTEVQSVIEAQLRSNRFRNVRSTVTQGWQNLVRSFNELDFAVTLTKTSQGLIEPTTITRLAMGTLFVGMMTLTSLPVTALMASIFGTMVFKPMVSWMAKRADTPGKAASSKLKWAMPIGLLIVGLFGHPLIATAGIGSLYNQMTETVFNVQAVDENTVVVNQRVENPGEKMGDDSGKSVSEARQSLIVAFHSAMTGKRKDGLTGYDVLRQLLAEDRFGGIRLNVGAWAQNYGYMHLIAAVFSMVPQAMESVSGVDLAFEEGAASQADEKMLGATIRVDKNSLRLLEGNASEIVLNQVLMAVVGKIFTTAEITSIADTLKRHAGFEQQGAMAVAELVKQFIVDGEALEKKLDGASWAVFNGESIYALLKNRLGRTVSAEEVMELESAMGELENEALPLMRQMAGEMRTLAGSELVAKQEEFAARFGVEYVDYIAMANQTLAERILVLFAGEKILNTKNPLVKIKRYGLQIMVMGMALSAGTAFVIAAGALSIPVALVIGGAAILLIVTGAMMRWQIAEQVAFHIDPSTTVVDRMKTSGFGIADKGGAEKTAKHDLDTLALLDEPVFIKALDNLKIRNTRMISEYNRNRAIQTVFNHLIRVMESPMNDQDKLQLTQEATQVLGFLGFDIRMQSYLDKDGLAVTMTPETTPRLLQQDYKMGRMIRRLEGLGIKINMQNLAPIKQPKLKTTGSAA